jgi:hypothetical protein
MRTIAAAAFLLLSTVVAACSSGGSNTGPEVEAAVDGGEHEDAAGGDGGEHVEGAPRLLFKLLPQAPRYDAKVLHVGPSELATSLNDLGAQGFVVTASTFDRQPSGAFLYTLWAYKPSGSTTTYDVIVDLIREEEKVSELVKEHAERGFVATIGTMFAEDPSLPGRPSYQIAAFRPKGSTATYEASVKMFSRDDSVMSRFIADAAGEDFVMTTLNRFDDWWFLVLGFKRNEGSWTGYTTSYAIVGEPVEEGMDRKFGDPLFMMTAAFPHSSILFDLLGVHPVARTAPYERRIERLDESRLESVARELGEAGFIVTAAATHKETPYTVWAYKE